MKKEYIFKQFLHYAALNVAGMLGLSCYILADTFFVSKGMGTNGLAALNLAIPVYSFIHGTGLMLGMGGATKFTILKAQGKNRHSNEIFTATVLTATVFSAFFALMGLLFSKTITSLLGADSEIFDMTNTYLRVILLFSPAFIANDVIICFVRNDGAPNLSMAAMLIGSLSNIIFDYIFIFPLGLGILGAVLATGFAPVVGMTIMSSHFFRHKNSFKITRTRVTPRLCGSLISLGLPSLVTELSSGVVIIIFNTLILSLSGNVGVAAYGIIANISLVVISIYTGISQGTQPIISVAVGEGNLAKLKKLVRYGVLSTVLLSAVIYALIFFFTAPIVSVFNSDCDVHLQAMAESGMKIYFTGALFAGINIIISTYFSSIAKPVPAQIISICRGFAVIIPLTFVLAKTLGLVGIWLTFPTAELIVTVISAVFYFRNRHTHRQDDQQKSSL